ncbi:MAG: aspartyl protease family protein [Nannocystaceae bacterium]|nr:aspartyl protease family protein [Nannocystaceae bacterium]
MIGSARAARGIAIAATLGCSAAPATVPSAATPPRSSYARTPAKWIPPGVAFSQDPSVVSFSAARGLIVVDAFVEGRDTPLRLAVDTGASIGTITADVAKELGLAQTRPQPVQAMSSTTHMPATLLPRTRVGGLEIEPRWVYVVPGRKQEETCDGPYRLDGVLAADVLWQVVTVIDHEAKRVRFQSTPAPMQDGEFHAEVRPGPEFVFLSSVGLAGRETPVLIDTGSAASMTVANSLLETLLVPGAVVFPFQGVAMFDATGPIEGGVFFQTVLSIGSEEVGLVRGLAMATDHDLVNLGNGLLREYLVTIDGPGAEIRLLPRPEGRSKRNPSLGFGFSRQGDHYTVGVLIEGSEVARAGVRVGDQVVELAGVRLDDLDLTGECALRDRLRHEGSVTAIFERDSQRFEVSFAPKQLFPEPSERNE